MKLKTGLIFIILTLGFNASILGQSEMEAFDFGDLTASTESSGFKSFLFSDVEITVASGSGKGEKVLETTSSVSIIDRSTIERYKFRTVKEALRTVAGFDVQRSYIFKQIPTARGIQQDHYANKVLVMINNVPLWNAVTGEGNLERVDINDVERIEVLKGGASVIYGTNAYTGAVNIVLKESDSGDNSMEMHGGYGKNEMIFGGGRFSYNEGDEVKFFASANFSKEDGEAYSFTDESGVTQDVSDHTDFTNVTLLTEYRNHTFLLNAYESEQTSLGVTPKFSAGGNQDQEVDGYMANYGYNHFWSDSVSTQANLLYDWGRRNLSRNAAGDIKADIVGYRYNGSVTNQINLSEDLNLEIGGDYGFRKSAYYKNERNGSETLSHNNMLDRDIYEWSLFAQADYKWNDFDFVVGLRNTDNQVFGSNTSSRATAIYNVNETNAIKLIGAQSFRTPSLFELFFATDQRTVFGNINLDPEESDTIELVWQSIFEQLYVQLGAYYAKYDQKIFRVRGSGIDPNGVLFEDVAVYDNVDEFTAKGAELELKYVTDLTDFFFNFNYIDGDDGDQVSAGSRFNFQTVPDFTWTAGFYREFGAFGFSGVVNHVDDAEGSTQTVDSSTWVDLNVNFTQNIGQQEVVHSLSLKNAFDEEVNIPEFVRQNINEIRLIESQKVFYTVKVKY